MKQILGTIKNVSIEANSQYFTDDIEIREYRYWDAVSPESGRNLAYIEVKGLAIQENLPVTLTVYLNDPTGDSFNHWRLATSTYIPDHIRNGKAVS